MLGMHRSGTSALAGLLSQMGAIAPKNLLPPTTENPKGYWESKPIMQLNDDILKELGSKWSDWRSIDFGSFPAEIIESITDRTRLILTKEFPESINVKRAIAHEAYNERRYEDAIKSYNTDPSRQNHIIFN